MWENWKGPSSGEWFHTFAIISSHANELVTDIHDRMPVILAPEITSHGLSYELATKAVFSSRSRYPNVRSRLEVLSKFRFVLCELCYSNLRFLLPVKGRPVAIYRLLQKSAFGPDDIERLTTAYESALRVLELNDRNDPITEIVARRIIEAAQIGLRDPDSLCATAIKDLRVP